MAYYLGDIGTVITVSTGVDLSAASTAELKIKKPDKTVTTWAASVSGGDNTQLVYTVVADDFDQAGTYKVQAYIVTASWTGRGNTASFDISNTFG